MAASKKALMILRTKEYLALHEQDPALYPANVAAVAKFVPVARRLFYKADPEIEKLVDEIESAERTAEKGQGVALTLVAAEDGLRGLSDEDLAAEVDQTIRRATWALQRWLGIAKRAPDVSEAAMVAAYLDDALRQARRAHGDLLALVRQVQSREPAVTDPLASGEPEQPDLL